jgi:hypothetical protein
MRLKRRSTDRAARRFQPFSIVHADLLTALRDGYVSQTTRDETVSDTLHEVITKTKSNMRITQRRMLLP